MINYTSQRITKVLGLIALTGLSGLIDAQAPSSFKWKSAGPIYNAGRARNMIVDKNDSKTLYVGSASSGIFKSTNSGSTWAPINDQGTVRNISYLAQAADGTIYAGTGEGFLRVGQKAKAQIGTGLYKLDIGNSLVQVVSSSVVGTVINRVACSQNGSNIALATNLGIYVSIAGGNFNPVTLPGAPTGTAISGQDVKFDSNGILYCSIGTHLAPTAASTVNPSKVYRSADASLSGFNPITPPKLSLPDDNYGRIELAIAPSDDNVIYASCANKFLNTADDNINEASATLKGLFVSYNGGANWELIIQGSAQLDPLSAFGILASGDYAQALTVNPTNPHQLFFAGYSFYVWTRTNVQPLLGHWAPLSNFLVPTYQTYIHENIHDIKYVGGTTPLVYFTTDAGVYRSIDLAPLLPNLPTLPATTLPSFQRFYKGMITGQFNSVSIERYPIADSVNSTTPGTAVVPHIGFIGGTGGNGLTYFSGTEGTVSSELNYIGGEIYNAEYSKILPNAALASTGSGVLYRSTNIKTSNPTVVKINRYDKELSKIAPIPEDFRNTGFTTGTPFKMWENYGQFDHSPDYIYFYNDSVLNQASMNGVPELISKTNFTFSASRPDKFAIIDSIVIRTGTVQLPVSNTNSNSPAFTGTNRQTIYASILPRNFNAHLTQTVLTTSSQGPVTGPVSVTLNPSTLKDIISVTFTAPPFANKTATVVGQVNDPSAYYRVFATVFYKYKAGDSLFVIDENISTRISRYDTVLTHPLSWRYGSNGAPSYTFSALANSTITGIPNPTFVITPSPSPAQTGPVFTVTPIGQTNYSISVTGTYSLNATPVVYTIEAIPNPGITPPLVYSISPGSYTQSTPVFTVDPTALTDYTITESGSNALTQETYSTVGTTTYVINPATGTLSQSGTVFVVSPTGTAAVSATIYTIQGISSNTDAGANTSISYTTYAANISTVLGTAQISIPPSNQPIKIRTLLSARLAMILNNLSFTGSGPAIVVSKNPLALNDPLSVVRVSQTGVYTDDANGNPTFNTTTVDGTPTVLEWSKYGTEIYYATSANKVYRVSHITDIMDLSPTSDAGKFYTDVFKYNPGAANNAVLNPESPYRTTLIGTFDKPITSISVSSDNKLVVSFNGMATGTTGLVMYTTNNAKTSSEASIGWVSKQGNLSNAITYCSLIEKDNDKMVFVGTDNGMFFTGDITGANWMNVSSNTTNQLPNVQIFDIKQQTFQAWDSYNSGQIYVATNGRGIWTTGEFFRPYAVGIEEHEDAVVKGNNLNIYPNPTNGNVNVAFNNVDGETAVLQVMDINGRVVQTENIGKLSAGETNYSFSTTNLSSGMYIVNVTSNSGVKRVSKLIVTK